MPLRPSEAAAPTAVLRRPRAVLHEELRLPGACLREAREGGGERGGRDERRETRAETSYPSKVRKAGVSSTQSRAVYFIQKTREEETRDL